MRPSAIAAAALLVAGLAACGTKAPAAPADCTGVPPLTGRVVDTAQLLGPEEEAKLVVELAQLERRTRDQLVVATVPSLRGRTIEELGLAMGRCWGVGRKGLDNGVILLVAAEDKRLRIEVGTGLENLLQDRRAQAIIDDAIVPEFKAGQFEAGIETGVARIEAVLLSDTRRPQRLPPPPKG